MDDRVHREVYKMNSNAVYVYAARVNEGMDGMFSRRDVTHGGISYVAIQERKCREAQQTRMMRST